MEEKLFVCEQPACALRTEMMYTSFTGSYTDAKKAGWTWAWRNNGHRYWRDDYCPDCTAKNPPKNNAAKAA